MKKKKEKIEKRTVKIPWYILFLGILLFLFVIWRLSFLALSESIDGINIKEFANSRNSTTKVLSASLFLYFNSLSIS